MGYGKGFGEWFNLLDILIQRIAREVESKDFFFKRKEFILGMILGGMVLGFGVILRGMVLGFGLREESELTDMMIILDFMSMLQGFFDILEHDIARGLEGIASPGFNEGFEVFFINQFEVNNFAKVFKGLEWAMDFSSI